MTISTRSLPVFPNDSIGSVGRKSLGMMEMEMSDADMMVDM